MITLTEENLYTYVSPESQGVYDVKVRKKNGSLSGIFEEGLWSIRVSY